MGTFKHPVFLREDKGYLWSLLSFQGLQPPDCCWSIQGGCRDGQRVAGRVGEAEGKLTFCVPEKAWQ